MKTAILTVPSVKSQEVANLLVDAGVKGILSFHQSIFHLPKDVVVQYVDLTRNSKPSSISCEKRIRKRKSFYENQLLGLQKRKTHPDDDIMMSYAAKGFVEGVKDAGGIPIILPIGDQEMASHYISMIDKLILTGGQNVDPKFYGEPKPLIVMTTIFKEISLSWPHQGSY